VRNRILTLRNRFGQILDGTRATEWQPDLAALDNWREPEKLLARGADRPSVLPKRIDVLVARHRHQQTLALAERESDTLRPQLDFAVTHGRNGIESQFGQAWEQTLRSNTYTNWKLFSAEWDSLVRAILDIPAHVIATARSKQAYEQVDVEGKKKVLKIGLQPVIRDGTEYEFALHFDPDRLAQQRQGDQERGHKLARHIAAYADRVDMLERSGLYGKRRKALHAQISDICTELAQRSHQVPYRTLVHARHAGEPVLASCERRHRRQRPERRARVAEKKVRALHREGAIHAGHRNAARSSRRA
jgi:hypothetical protein